MAENSSFPTYSFSDWKQAFSKEVGEESIESFNFTIDGNSYIPYATAEKEHVINGCLPKKYEKIRLGEFIDFRNNNKPVAKLLSSLSHGFDSPVILIDEKVNLNDFDGIHMDFITPTFQFLEGEYGEQMNFIRDLNSKYKEKGWTANYILPSQIESSGNQNFLFQFDTQDSVKSIVGELFSKINDYSSPELLTLRFKLTGQLIKDVIKTRAVKIAYLNYLHQHDLPIIPYSCQIIWDLNGNYPDEVLFHTNNIVAATMSQADEIIMNLGDTEGDRSRILRNSAHIALIESVLGNDSDPVAGSYFIEKVAADLAEKALNS